MFDPPDYPYKDITETLREYGTDDLLFSGNLPGINNLAVVAPTNLNACERTFHQNDSGRFFTATPVTDNTTGAEYNTELLIINPENILNDAPTLLDENTVNQFLLPLQVTTAEKKNEAENGPDLLALQSCVLCHEIFTTDAELLDHTISFHATDDTLEKSLQLSPAPASNLEGGLLNLDSALGAVDLDTEWLVCCVCDRVLSTALETESSAQLCCNDGTEGNGVTKRSLHTMFVCDFCSGLFASADSLDKHKGSCDLQQQQQQSYYYADPTLNNVNVVLANGVEVSQPKASYATCDVCSKQFTSGEELQAHAVVCHQMQPPKSAKHPYVSSSSSKMWNCGSCNQLFATARELYRHKRGEDRPAGAPLTAHVCEDCDKVLGSMCALHTHRKMHKHSKPGYPCRICGRRFNQSGHLAIHMRMHTGERPYPCDLCPKAFKVKVERDDHRRTHTGERPFACTACPKTFTAAARLREHARIHTDQRPYRCDICGAAFRRPYARTVHTLIHTGEKPHECDICGTAFRRSGDMWKHKRTIHGTQLPADGGKTI